MSARINSNKCYVLTKKVNPVSIPSDLPVNWLNEQGDMFATILSLNAVASTDLKKHIQRHAGANSTYTLKSDLLSGLFNISRRLSDKTKVLADSAKAAIVFKIVEDIEHCTPGFHDRVNDVVRGFYFPEDLDEHLTQIRNDIVETVAHQSTKEVHTHNRFYIIALSMGYGVKQINSQDVHPGQLSDEVIQKVLKPAFDKHFQVPILLHKLIEGIKGVLHREYEYSGRQEQGYTIKYYGQFITYLVKIFKEPLNHYDYLILNDKSEVLDLNWRHIKQKLFEKLLTEQYFLLPEDEKNCINSLMQVTEHNHPIDVTCLFTNKFTNSTTGLCSLLSFLEPLSLSIQCDLIKRHINQLEVTEQCLALIIIAKEYKNNHDLGAFINLLFKEAIKPLVQKKELDKVYKGGATLTYFAAQEGLTFFVAELAKNGADLNKATIDDYTPAHVAARNGHETVIAELAKYRANLKATNKYGTTPAVMATHHGHTKVIVELAKNGVDFKEEYKVLACIAALKGYASIIAELAKSGFDFNITFPIGWTISVSAAYYGHSLVLVELAKTGADFNKPGKSGETPVFLAAQNGHLSVITHLINYGAKLTLPFRSTPQSLREFASTRSAEVISRMEDFIRSQVKLANNTILMTALDISYVMGHKEVSELLKKHAVLTPVSIQNQLKSFESLLIDLYNKGDEFLVKQLQAKQQNDSGKENRYQTAFNQATNLYQTLQKLKEDYQKNTIALPEFKKQSLEAIEGARPVLQQHRGWKEVLGNIALCILGLVPVFKYLLTNSFFKFQTQSEVILDDLKNTVIRQEIPSH